MKILCTEEYFFENCLLEKIISSRKDIFNRFLKFVVKDLSDCILFSLKINPALELEEILEQDLISRLEKEAVLREFEEVIKREEGVDLKLEIEMGCDEFFILMRRLSYFILQKEKEENEVELRFLDSIYEKFKK